VTCLFIRKLTLVSGLLALPLAGLLFAQWPLREVFQAYSRQANDVAQILFALYVSVAISAASRAKVHLAAFKPVKRSVSGLTGWRPFALLVCLGPWTIFMLWAAAPQIASSVIGLEKFGETLTPGFFMVKLALGLMLVLILLELLLGLIERPGASS
jgi:hypothetical protein